MKRHDVKSKLLLQQIWSLLLGKSKTSISAKHRLNRSYGIQSGPLDILMAAGSTGLPSEYTMNYMRSQATLRWPLMTSVQATKESCLVTQATKQLTFSPRLSASHIVSYNDLMNYATADTIISFQILKARSPSNMKGTLPGGSALSYAATNVHRGSSTRPVKQSAMQLKTH